MIKIACTVSSRWNWDIDEKQCPLEYARILRIQLQQIPCQSLFLIGVETTAHM